MKRKITSPKSLILWIIILIVVTALFIGYLSGRKDKHSSKTQTEAVIQE